ncbi:MAG: type II toxin-antitoxin system RelB/DinJ family antitoxin [Clostridiales bacterium]|nr:type II toxin-antitoxin system RelB/DinJ family antitoxin [Clostridiales bacterium]
MIAINPTDLTIKVDPITKAQAEPILTAIGLSFSDVFNLLLRQISLKHRIPFDLSDTQLTENGYTEEFEVKLLVDANDMHEAVANKTAKIYNNSCELFADMDAEDDEID